MQQLSAAPAWTASIPATLSLSVAPDGSAVAGSAVAPGGGDQPWAFAASGQALALDGAGGSAVFALSRGLVVVGPGIADPPGPASVLGSAGVIRSDGGTVGPITATGNVSGSRLAIVDSGSGTAAVLGWSAAGALQAESVPRLRGLGASAAVQFDDAGDALVVDAQHAALYSAGGSQEWSVPLKPNALPRSFVFDRDGAGVTAASSGSDNTLYQFVVSGDGHATVSWSEPLAPGGANQLVAGPQGRVALLDVGGTATFAVYREQDGALQWQDTLPTPAGAAQAPAVTGLAFGPGGGAVVAATGCTDQGASCLLFVDASGAPLGTLTLPAGAAIALAADGLAAAVVEPSAPDAAGGTLQWLDLSAAWGAIAAAEPSAASSS